MFSSRKRKKKNLYLKIKILLFFMPLILLIGMLIVVSMFIVGGNSGESIKILQKSNTTAGALSDAAYIYSDTNIHWLDLLAAYAADNNNDWEHYSKTKLNDIAETAKKLKHENTNFNVKDIVKNEESFEIYKQLYNAIYGNLINTYIQGNDNSSSTYFYYNTFFPIASDYKISYSDDFMDPRSFGDITYHDGNDIIGRGGIPIIAVEDGEIETIGWNSAGGWRIGIRSGTNGERFWYYAHMRKVHPYYRKIHKGEHVTAGQVIGYIGSTGYSNAVPVNIMPDKDTLTHPDAVEGKFIEHLHIGLRVKVKLKEGMDKEINEWVNPYPILKFLEANMASVNEEKTKKLDPATGSETEETTGDYISVEKKKESRVFGMNRG